LSKELPAWRIWAEYVPARVILWIFGIMPLPVSVWISNRLCDLAFFILKKHRKRATDNLVMAFGVHQDHALDLTRRVFRHLGLMFVEVSKFMQLSPEKLRACLDNPESIEDLRQKVPENRPLITVSGHIGNWEMCGLMTIMAIQKVTTIGRPLNNPKLDELINRSRSRMGQQMISKFGFFRPVIRMLKRQESPIGILIDQDAGQQGMIVPFFGIPASTVPVVAELAMRTNAVVCMLVLNRAGKPMRFRYKTSRVIDPQAENLNREELTLMLNRMLEDYIRQEPDQWLWMHRRWKTQQIGDGTSAEDTAGSSETEQDSAEA